MSRFPLVLGAVVSSCHPDRQSPLFGIFPLWSFLTSDRTLAFDIGPNGAWFQSGREYRLLTDEALRTLRSEFPKEELADRLLRAVPEFCGRIILASDSPHRSWMGGRHPQKPWAWYFQDVFRVLDDPPPAGTQPAEGGKPKPAGRRNRGRGKNIDARMLKAISENREAIGWSVRQWAEHLECQISTVAETRTWKEHLAKYRDAQRVDRAE